MTQTPPDTKHWSFLSSLERSSAHIPLMALSKLWPSLPVLPHGNLEKQEPNIKYLNMANKTETLGDHNSYLNRTEDKPYNASTTNSPQLDLEVSWDFTTTPQSLKSPVSSATSAENVGLASTPVTGGTRYEKPTSVPTNPTYNTTENVQEESLEDITPTPQALYQISEFGTRATDQEFRSVEFPTQNGGLTPAIPGVTHQNQSAISSNSGNESVTQRIKGWTDVKYIGSSMPYTLLQSWPVNIRREGIKSNFVNQDNLADTTDLVTNRTCHSGLEFEFTNTLENNTRLLSRPEEDGSELSNVSTTKPLEVTNRLAEFTQKIPGREGLPNNSSSTLKTDKFEPTVKPRLNTDEIIEADRTTLIEAEVIENTTGKVFPSRQRYLHDTISLDQSTLRYDASNTSPKQDEIEITDSKCQTFGASRKYVIIYPIGNLNEDTELAVKLKLPDESDDLVSLNKAKEFPNNALVLEVELHRKPWQHPVSKPSNDDLMLKLELVQKPRLTASKTRPLGYKLEGKSLIQDGNIVSINEDRGNNVFLKKSRKTSKNKSKKRLKGVFHKPKPGEKLKFRGKENALKQKPLKKLTSEAIITRKTNFENIISNMFVPQSAKPVKTKELRNWYIRDEPRTEAEAKNTYNSNLQLATSSEHNSMSEPSSIINPFTQLRTSTAVPKIRDSAMKPLSTLLGFKNLFGTEAIIPFDAVDSTEEGTESSLESASDSEMEATTTLAAEVASLEDPELMDDFNKLIAEQEVRMSELYGYISDEETVKRSNLAYLGLLKTYLNDVRRDILEQHSRENSPGYLNAKYSDLEFIKNELDGLESEMKFELAELAEHELQFTDTLNLIFQAIRKLSPRSNRVKGLLERK